MTTAAEAVPADAAVAAPSRYWDDIAGEWNGRRDGSAWRTVSDAVNRDLIERWLPPAPDGAVLKTDLFDELVGDGLAGTLLGRFGSVTGIDVSAALVDIVRMREPRTAAHVADVRHLPFADAAFAAVVSNSTLDHFSTPADIAASLAELHRVLRPGGSLLVTLDNGMNPAVAVRNALPAPWREASRLVPFAVGATCRTPRELELLLERAGFEVANIGAVLHCPRVLGVLAGSAVDRRGGARARDRYRRALVACERLSRLPSRFVTGHFLAARAVKR
jgi:SAM-dependent methyltransferase